MFETVFIRIYEHEKINIPKAELSNQLFGNLSKFYEPLLKQIDPYKLGDKRRKLDIGGQYAKRILAQFSTLKDQTKIREFVDFLVDGCPDHSYVIDYDLIRLFLDNIYTSEMAFGKIYADKLSEISQILITDNNLGDFIGFVEVNKEPNMETVEEVKNKVESVEEMLEKIQPATEEETIVNS